MEDERGGGASVDRSRAETGTCRRHHRRRRSLRPPARRPTGEQHSPRPRCRLAGLHQRCRRRQRSDPFNGGYVWYDVLGITPSRERSLDEVKDQVEAQMARGPDRQPAAHQGDRDGAEARSGRQTCRRGGSRRIEGRDRDGIQARCLAARRARQRDHGGVSHRQGRQSDKPPAPAAANGSCSA